VIIVVTYLLPRNPSEKFFNDLDESLKPFLVGSQKYSGYGPNTQFFELGDGTIIVREYHVSKQKGYVHDTKHTEFYTIIKNSKLANVKEATAVLMSLTNKPKIILSCETKGEWRTDFDFGKKIVTTLRDYREDDIIEEEYQPEELEIERNIEDNARKLNALPENYGLKDATHIEGIRKATNQIIAQTFPHLKYIIEKER
jgi:hypothetical protein